MLRLFLAWLCLLLPAPLLAGWKVAETPNFRLHARLSADDLAARAATLQDFHALLVQVTGRSPPVGAPPLDVFLVDRLEDATPWRPLPEGILGYYRADSGRISAVSLSDVSVADGRSDRDGLTAQQLLQHEYAHHFLLGSGRFAYPAWYVEGFAEYFATASFQETQIDYGLPSPARIAALQTGNWLPMEQLLAREPGLPRGDGAALFYAQSWLLTHYLFANPSLRARLPDYLKATAAGQDPVLAFRRTIDPDLVGFQRKLRRYGTAPLTSVRSERPPAAAAPLVQTLPTSADGLLLRKVALEHGAVPDRAAALADVQKQAAAYPADVLAARTLALAELQVGSPQSAARLLDALLADAPRDPELLRWRAQAARSGRTGGSGDKGSIEVARRLLVRAYSADPSDWRTLHAYARLYRRTSAPLPDEVMPLLLRAYALAPQVTEVVLDTALALANAGRLGDAAAVLEPLAWAPHGGPAAELAQRMLLRARAGDQAGLLAEVQAARQSKAAVQSSRMAALQSRQPGAAVQAR